VTGEVQSGPVPTAVIEAIRGHPDFPAAMRQSVAELVGAHARNRLLNRLISDRGRALFGIYALDLHFDADKTGARPTPSRMAELCAETGVCSRGRVRALLLLLRWAGHLAPQAGSGDRRRRPLVPTAQMMTAYRSRWGRQLAIIAPIDPAAGTVAGRLDHPEVFARLALELGGLRLESMRIVCRPLLALQSFFVATFAAMIVAAMRVLDGEGTTSGGLPSGIDEPPFSRPVPPSPSG
jgi:hypothetical protein